MDEKRREYMRQYMAKKRLKVSGNKTPAIQTKDLGTDGGLRDADVGAMLCPECGGEEEHRDGCPSRRPQETFPVSSGDAVRAERSGAIVGVEPKSDTLSKTDQAFDEDRPGWYIFGKEVKDGKCWTCGKGFKTQLEMNRFCSPKCKNDYLAQISRSKNEISLES